MVEYDGKVIRQYAEALYRQAESVMLVYIFAGGILSGALGYGAEQLRGGSADNTLLWVALVVGIGGGYGIGKEKAFSLKLQAQTALCQKKIEENTHPRP